MCPKTELRSDMNSGKLINYNVPYRNYSRLLKSEFENIKQENVLDIKFWRQ